MHDWTAGLVSGAQPHAPLVGVGPLLCPPQPRPQLQPQPQPQPAPHVMMAMWSAAPSSGHAAAGEQAVDPRWLAAAHGAAAARASAAAAAGATGLSYGVAGGLRAGAGIDPAARYPSWGATELGGGLAGFPGDPQLPTSPPLAAWAPTARQTDAKAEPSDEHSTPDFAMLPPTAPPVRSHWARMAAQPHLFAPAAEQRPRCAPGLLSHGSSYAACQSASMAPDPATARGWPPAVGFSTHAGSAMAPPYGGYGAYGPSFSYGPGGSFGVSFAPAPAAGPFPWMHFHPEPDLAADYPVAGAERTALDDAGISPREEEQRGRAAYQPQDSRPRRRRRGWHPAVDEPRPPAYRLRTTLGDGELRRGARPSSGSVRGSPSDTTDAESDAAPLVRPSPFAASTPCTVSSRGDATRAAAIALLRVHDLAYSRSRSREGK